MKKAILSPLTLLVFAAQATAAPIIFQSAPDGWLAEGTYGTGTNPAEVEGYIQSGYHTISMWYPAKAAFRAGHFYGPYLDSSNIGNFSAAFGTARASGDYSAAFGMANASGYASFAGVMATSSGAGAFAWGEFASALGSQSFAFGADAQAYGLDSFAFGYSSASGSGSTAFGMRTQSDSLNSFAIGRYNVGGGNPTSWVETDPLFEIGNGTYSNRSNALTVYKNGDAELAGGLSLGGNLTLSGNITSSSGEVFATRSGVGVSTLPTGTSFQVSGGASRFDAGVGIGKNAGSGYALDIAGKSKVTGELEVTSAIELSSGKVKLYRPISHTTSSDQIWVLCKKAAGTNEILGTFRGQRSSGYWGAAQIDVLISTASVNSGYRAMLTVQQGLYTSTDRWSLVEVTVSGEPYFALRYQGTPYALTNFYFDGYATTSGSASLFANYATGSSLVTLNGEIPSSATRFYTSAERVGFGVNLPEERVHVGGNIKADGTVSATNVQASTATFTGEVTIARVPPQGDILMGQFGN